MKSGGRVRDSDLETCTLSEEELERVSQPDASGPLLKRSGLGWYKYHFALKGSRLMFFEKKNSVRGPILGTINLFNAKVIVADPTKRPMEFDVVEQRGKAHSMRAGSKLEMQYWLTMFAAARKMTPPPKPFASKNSQPDPDPGVNKIRTERIPNHIRVDRVLMVVHGIGTQEEALAKNAGALLQTSREVMDRVFPDIDFNLEVLVVHWRDSVLNLRTHEKIMGLAPSFQGSNALREFILNRVFDGLYYTRDRLRNFVWREVVSQLNAHYAEFKKRHPEFRGKVCLFAHSLGGVIIYEILSRQVTDDPRLLESEGIKLDFEVESLYAVGSPLGGFLVLEFHMGTINLRPHKVPFRLYNIFHPNDPVAMRIEPVIDDRFTNIAPVVLPHWKTMDKTQNAVKWLGGLWKRERDNDANLEDLKWARMEDNAPRNGTPVRNSPKGRLDRRYDFTLQVLSAIEEVSTAYSAMKAHAEYWNSRDVSLFVVTTMVRGMLSDQAQYRRASTSRMSLTMFQLLVATQMDPQRSRSLPSAGVAQLVSGLDVPSTPPAASIDEQVEALVLDMVDAVAMQLSNPDAMTFDEDGDNGHLQEAKREGQVVAGSRWWGKWFNSRRDSNNSGGAGNQTSAAAATATAAEGASR